MAKIKGKSYEEVRTAFAAGGCTLLTTEYKNNREKLDYICSCGTIAKITFGSFRDGQRCVKCKAVNAARMKRTPYDIVRRDFEAAGFILLTKDYTDNKQKLRYICSCGREADTTYDRIKRGAKCWQCRNENNKGPNNFSWNPNLTDEERQEKRDYSEYVQWRKDVYERDRYTCQHCKRVGGKLNAHHIEPFSTNQELRTELSNGVTLCQRCHRDFHARYGYKGFTKGQFDEWQLSLTVGVTA